MAMIIDDKVIMSFGIYDLLSWHSLRRRKSSRRSTASVAVSTIKMAEGTLRSALPQKQPDRRHLQSPISHDRCSIGLLSL